MTWNEFLWFAIPAMMCWIAAGILVYKCKKAVVVEGLMIAGIAIFAAFIVGLWIGQERPPLRTIGETRLWYSFFLATVGYLGKNKVDTNLYALMDNIVYIGFGFLILGMLMGAVWAKEAWGHYWSWDPKETWAFITSAAYLIYIHMRLQKGYARFVLWVLPIAFILLMITWIGVNYLPAAQNSIHVYSN